jgi:hypothetical protein
MLLMKTRLIYTHYRKPRESSRVVLHGLRVVDSVPGHSALSPGDVGYNVSPHLRMKALDYLFKFLVTIRGKM